MNFFERQQQVRAMSGRLVLLFALAVVGIIVTVDLVMILVFGGFGGQPPETLAAIVIVTSVVMLAIIGLSSLFRALYLRGGGGGKVARALGGRPVPQDTTDPHLRRLRNVVEEIAIASGTPVPELYVLEGQPGINAFAAGWSTSDAAVAVTRGALEHLNRDELQGVIAHEFSHVVNGDMRLNIKLMGLLFGILVLYFIGRVLLRIRGGNRNPVPLIGLALVVCGLVGLLVGRIIKAAVSRQREYLADASAVQFTRQTSGLTGALKKIAGLPTGSQINHAKSEDVSHMLFGSGRGLSGMFATHPPLVKRIQALDPTITTQELEQLRQRWSAAPPSGLHEDALAMGLAEGGAAPAGGHPGQPAGPGSGQGSRHGAGHASALPSPVDVSIPATPERVIAAVGAPAAGGFHRGESILGQIPDQLLDRARGRDTVVPLVLGLLLSGHPEVRVHQHAALVSRFGQTIADAAWQEGGALTTLHPMLRLPLAEVAFPALRNRPRPEQDAIMGAVHALVQVDGRLSVSEYCLSRLMHEELYEAVHRQPAWGKRRYSLSASRDAAATLLATLAQAGHSDPAAAAQAFSAGIGQLYPGEQLQYAPPVQGVGVLEGVWPALDGLDPDDKQRLLHSMVTVIGHDGEMTVSEMELLRTICALLHCPLPPISGADLEPRSQDTAAGPPHGH